MANQECIQYNATTPDINRGPLVSSLSNNLRGCIVGTPAGSLKHPPIFHEIRKAEIDNFDHFTGIYEDVFRF
jgi:hypothetical protein